MVGQVRQLLCSYSLDYHRDLFGEGKHGSPALKREEKEPTFIQRKLVTIIDSDLLIDCQSRKCKETNH